MAGDIVNSQRACLNPSHVDKLIFLEKNYSEKHLLWSWSSYIQLWQIGLNFVFLKLTIVVIVRNSVHFIDVLCLCHLSMFLLFTMHQSLHLKERAQYLFLFCKKIKVNAVMWYFAIQNLILQYIVIRFFSRNTQHYSGEKDFKMSSMYSFHFIIISPWKRARPFIWIGVYR